MIQFAYFDLGNVLVGFSHQKACRQLAGISGRTVKEVEHLLFESPLQMAFERGELDTPQICGEIRRGLGFEAGDARIETAISDIFWPLEDSRHLVESLARTGIPMGILSNTCDAHWRQVNAVTAPWLRDVFSVFMLSFELGSAKPDAAIYGHAIAAAAVAPDTVFFVDDRPENVAAAAEAGIAARLFTGVSALRQDLQELGIGLTA